MLWFFFFVFFVFLCFYKISLLLKSGTTHLDDPPPIQNTPMPSSSSRSYSYDVFLSFRGEDVRKKFVDHLYKDLEKRSVLTYKDDITPPRGESVAPALLKAIEESHIAVIIFSKNYADSSWCLDELVHIMKCRSERGQIVIPIFYDVEPTEVRNQKGDFGKAFAKLTKVSVWRKLFAKQETLKVEMWRKALVAASNISGWEPKNVANGHEATVIQIIVDAISDKLFSRNSDIDKEFVGMTERVNDLIKELKIGPDGVRMVGIWGDGGGGKTTLATCVYRKISHHFRDHCIMVDNIREKSSKSGLEKLQEYILNKVLKIEVSVESVDLGKGMIEDRLCHSNVLILLDDVDDPKQLEALAGSHSWFGPGSRIIITTRNKHALQKVDYVSRVRLLSQDESIQLLKKYAYNDKKPLKDYWELSLRVVSYAHGLPLAVTVLGTFLYDKDKAEWMSTLDKLKDIPQSEILKQLRISYDGLDTKEKELFLDIACFFRGQRKDDLSEILEALGLYPHIGIKVLIQKALITIDPHGRFDMHDLLQEMGQYIVRGEPPYNPETHSRLWKYEEIRNMRLGDATMENDKTDQIYPYNIDDPPLIYLKMVPNIKKLRWLIVENGSSEAPDFLSNDLQFIDWYGYFESRFPDSFQPTNLAVLKITWGLQKELWKGWKFLPQLKVLLLHDMRQLVSTPDFDGLPSLQTLELIECYRLKEIHPSLGNHKTLKHLRVSCAPSIKNFPRIDLVENLKTLHISRLNQSFSGILNIQSDMKNLVKMFLGGYGMGGFLSSVAVHCPKLISLELHEADPYGGLNHSSKLDFKLSQLTVLVHLDLSGCKWLEKFPEFPPSIVIFVANKCYGLTDVGDSIRNCKCLCQVSVRDGSILNDGDRLLQSMLQGKAIENHSMVLQLEGLQISREFQPRLRAGGKCTLQPQDDEVWKESVDDKLCNKFCGFLMCAVIKGDFHNRINPKITMKKVMGGSMGIDSQDDEAWKESVDDKETWVGYVSFSSLSLTAAWFDDTYKALSFSIDIQSPYKDQELCGGFGVSLVRRTSGSGPTDTSLPEYYSEIDKKKYDFKPEFEIEDDLTCTFRIPSTVYW